MTLFDEFFETLITNDSPLQFRAGTLVLRVYKNSDDTSHYTVERRAHPDSNPFETSFLTRSIAEEFLTHLILNDKKCSKVIAEALPDAPSLKELQKRLRSDHALVVKRVEKHSDTEEVLRAATHVLAEYLQQKPNVNQPNKLVLRANSQDHAGIGYVDNAFQYESGSNWGDSAPDEQKTLQTEEEFHKLLVDGSHIGVEDGRITGVVHQTLTYALEKMYDADSIRIYLQKKER